MAKKVKPDQRFSMERDGFFGEYYRAKENAFPGKCVIAFGGSVGKFLLSQLSFQRVSLLPPARERRRGKAVL